MEAELDRDPSKGDNVPLYAFDYEILNQTFHGAYRLIDPLSEYVLCSADVTRMSSLAAFSA